MRKVQVHEEESRSKSEDDKASLSSNNSSPSLVLILQQKDSSCHMISHKPCCGIYALALISIGSPYILKRFNLCLSRSSKQGYVVPFMCFYLKAINLHTV